MKYLIALSLVCLAYADPIYYNDNRVSPLPAIAQGASPYIANQYAAGPWRRLAAAASYPVAIAADDTLNLNAASKVMGLDQASVSVPTSYASASYAPAMQAFAPATTRVYNAASLPTLDAAASGFPSAVAAEDSLAAAAKALAMDQANFGAASSYAPLYKSVVEAVPSTFASAPIVAVTEFAPAATRFFASAGAAASHAIQALNSATPMSELTSAATRVFAHAGAAANHVLNPVFALTEFSPAATRVFAPAGAAATHAMYALGPAAAVTNYAPAATRWFASAAHPAGATVDLSDSGVYNVNHLSQIA